MRRIRELIEGRDTVVVAPSSSVFEAARLMKDRQIGALPVLEGDRVAGIFTERDVMCRVVAAGRDPGHTLVAEVMSTELIVVDVNESYEACLSQMRRAGVRHILVLSADHLVGILSLRDLLALDANEKEEAIKLLNAYVHYIPVDLTRPKAPHH